METLKGKLKGLLGPNKLSKRIHLGGSKVNSFYIFRKCDVFFLVSQSNKLNFSNRRFVLLKSQIRSRPLLARKGSNSLCHTMTRGLTIRSLLNDIPLSRSKFILLINSRYNMVYPNAVDTAF